MIGGIVLAGGRGRRFGGPKQLAEVGGSPLLDHAVGAMAAVPTIERIVVVLGAHAEQVREQARLDGVEVVVAEDWSEGISASLRAGIRVLSCARAVVVTLGDQPFITPQVIAAVAGSMGTRAPAARATYDGVPGHPVVIRRELFDELLALRGDSGARELLERVGVREVECAELADPADVDTPADLNQIRRAAIA